jgi:hypothetical protein
MNGAMHIAAFGLTIPPAVAYVVIEKRCSWLRRMSPRMTHSRSPRMAVMLPLLSEEQK